MVDHASFQTELGRVGLSWTPKGISGLRFLNASNNELEKESPKAPLWVLEAMRRIMAHLHGDPEALEGIPIDFVNCTPFQRQVAEVLRHTRPGDQLSYGDVARLCGKPGAARAVGQAVKRNPILILIPCHRVLASREEGGWSAFGSVDVKVQLRRLEKGSG